MRIWRLDIWTTYKNIAKLLDEKRIDREKYINLVVDNLEKTLEKHNIKAKVYGRVKHIYSIWRKMLRKKLDYAEIYDVRAIRIIVNEVSECYGVLGIVHSLWEHIPKEFDDYIARPKPNGYQSLHTAVIGPDGKVIEIQIRTKKMDEISELGVASHWRYKEKVKYDIGYEEKLSLLRKALNWQEELVVSQDAQEGVSIEDRVYVFTPQGDVVDLPYGSTPLDFAYKIHTDIGHRCRGAKLNGKIATLNTKLESGTLVEILTAKKGEPSRDWLNPNLGFVKTVRARSKIQSWFKKQDREQNIHDGRELLSKELKRLGIFNVNIKEIITGLSDINTEDDFYAAIAVGDVRISQVLGIVQKLVKAKTGESQAIISEENIVKSRQDLSKTPAFKISIQGIGNLVHHFAKCCKPNPSDEIIGYITMNGSVSIHKRDCINILQARKNKQNRLIEVIWGHHKQKKYFKIKLNIKAYKRRGLLKDISNVLETEDIDLLSIKSSVKEDEHLVFFHFIIEVPSFTKLEAILSKIQQLQNVVDVYREVES